MAWNEPGKPGDKDPWGQRRKAGGEAPDIDRIVRNIQQKFAGLFGGALSMTAYAPFCPELGMTFMTLYYCLPILVMAGIGWMFGPRLLRW